VSAELHAGGEELALPWIHNPFVFGQGIQYRAYMTIMSKQQCIFFCHGSRAFGAHVDVIEVRLRD
jgi:hypothetical protein